MAAESLSNAFLITQYSHVIFLLYYVSVVYLRHTFPYVKPFLFPGILPGHEMISFY